MTELSRVAQTVLDFATSQAKRNWSESVNEIHLVSAVRHWDEEWFDTKFPGIAEELERLLAKTKGDVLQPQSIDPRVLSHLEAVRGESELKELAKTLIDTLKEQINQTSDHQSNAVLQEVNDNREYEEEDDARVTLQQSGTPKGSLQLTKALATQISELLGHDTGTVRGILASDGAFIGYRILKRSDPEIITAIRSALDIEADESAKSTFPGLLRRLVSVEHPNTARVATQLALAYVDIGEFAASLDDEFTDSELDEIDSIRMECREVLAGNVDATSDAIIEFERKFGELVGMEDVKRDLRKRVDFLMVTNRRAARGIATDPQRMHMAFIGNPGTGKTTVARLFGQLLNDLGLLPSDIFIEKDRSGLVGTHVGQTEEKTRSAIRQAEGGVLFIDEAYALNDRYGSQKGFGEEAVDVLVKEMEDKRDRLVVILAGYQKPMEAFMVVNPGLKSRIPSTIIFPDYSIEELVMIASNIADRRGLVISEPALQKLTNMFDVISKNEGFGNARDVENIMDATQRNLVMRLSPLGNLATEKESKTIIPDDLPVVNEGYKSKQIGFARRP